jgi:hypothetical protein
VKGGRYEQPRYQRTDVPFEADFVMSGHRIIHTIASAREYYVMQVGRALEVRARDTHAVLEVVRPPKEWGDDWLWSCCEFDGVQCVSVDHIRLLRTNVKGPSGGGAATSSKDEASRADAGGTEETTVAGQSVPRSAPPLPGTFATSRDWQGECRNEGSAASNAGRGLPEWAPLQTA